MYVKLPPGDLNLALAPNTPQVFIVVELPPHQGCAVVSEGKCVPQIYWTPILRMYNELKKKKACQS